jgi:RNA recognition motif-containing protein
MNTKLYLSDLANTTTYQEIMDLFSAHGNVVEISLATDRVTGRPLGTALVKMATPEGARMAIQALHGKNMGTTTLTVSEAELLGKGLSANMGGKLYETSSR